jgi:chromosome segregation ATPase
MGFDLDIADNGTDGAHGTTAQLKTLRDQYQTDFQAAVLNGCADEMISLDTKIKSLQTRIFAASVSEIKAEMEAIGARKTEIDSEIEALERLKASRNKRLARAILVVERRQLEAAKVGASLFAADSELMNSRERVRDLRGRLDGILNKKVREINIENERFETI